MEKKADKESGFSVGAWILDNSAVIYVLADKGYRGKSSYCVGRYSV